jgi:hypothetical protein
VFSVHERSWNVVERIIFREGLGKINIDDDIFRHCLTLTENPFWIGKIEMFLITIY